MVERVQRKVKTGARVNLIRHIQRNNERKKETGNTQRQDKKKIC